ncbi:MAG: ABC transporter substrate-binding protein [Rhodocyclaceae bacterium]|nr:ABC transporter substrate-binding protein [Rhodocyclaceae bacterium]
MLLAALLAGCGKQEPLRIGFIGELTGRSTDLAEAGRNGLTLAVERLRDQGIPGRPVEILVRNTGDNAATARAAAEELVAARVDAIIGPMTTTMAETIQPVTEKAGVVLVSPTASAVKFHGKDDLLFRMNWTTRDNGRAYARRSLDKGIRRIGVAASADNRSFSESWLNEYRAAFEAGGGKVVAVRFFASANEDHGPVVGELVAAGPDALLFVANAVDSARLAQQARKHRPGLPLIAAEWAGTDQLIELGGRAVEGMALVQNYDREDKSDRFLTFRDTYTRRFGREPVFGSVLTFDAGAVVLQALARRPAGMPLKEALIRLGPFDGLQRPVTFDANGDTERVAHHVVVRDGRFATEP